MARNLPKSNQNLPAPKKLKFSGVGLSTTKIIFSHHASVVDDDSLADRLVFLDDTHEAMFSHETEDILMDGFFVRLSRDY